MTQQTDKTPTHAEILAWLDIWIAPPTDKERMMRRAIRNLIASLTPTKSCILATDIGWPHKSGMRLCGEKDLTDALTAAELSGYERGRADGVPPGVNQKIIDYMGEYLDGNILLIQENAVRYAIGKVFAAAPTPDNSKRGEK